MNNFFIPIVVAIGITACSTTELTTHDRTSGYDLNKPSAIAVLPDTLHEVSGLTDIDDHTVACIQDENGVLFFYCLLYTSDAADERSSVDLGGRRIIKKKTNVYLVVIWCNHKKKTNMNA